MCGTVGKGLEVSNNLKLVRPLSSNFLLEYLGNWVSGVGKIPGILYR